MCMLNLGPFCLALHPSFHLCFEEKFHIFFALILVARMAECHSWKGCVLELAQAEQLAQEKETIPVSRRFIYSLSLKLSLLSSLTIGCVHDHCPVFHPKQRRRHVFLKYPRNSQLSMLGFHGNIGILVTRSSLVSRKWPSTIVFQLFSEEGCMFFGVTLGPVSEGEGKGHHSTTFISFKYCVLVRFLLKNYFNDFKEV